MKLREHKLGVAIYLALIIALAVMFPSVYVIGGIVGITFYCLLIFITKPERRCRDCGHNFFLSPLTYPIIQVKSLTCTRCGAKVKNRHR